MLPTLIGRIQTRIVLLVVIGGAVTLAVIPALERDLPLTERYHTAFVVLAAVTVLGVGWEFLYHFAMQWRWEKDWPTLFGLATMLPEGVLVWALLQSGSVPLIGRQVSPVTFVVQFVLVWLAAWLTANGPMRVPFLRWRFRGGRVL
jgi:hypothetical protein